MRVLRRVKRNANFWFVTNNIKCLIKRLPLRHVGALFIFDSPTNSVVSEIKTFICDLFGLFFNNLVIPAFVSYKQRSHLSIDLRFLYKKVFF